MKTLALAAIAALVPMAALAAETVTVSDAYARSANPKAGAAFMRLENHGENDCVLTAAASDAAELVELHTHKEEGGVMQMLKVDSITVPAGQTHDLARGGDHVMFMGLKQPWSNGLILPLALDFGDCGTVQIEVPVDNDRAADAAPVGGGHMHGMHGTAAPAPASN